jgi:hypothetical protein
VPKKQKGKPTPRGESFNKTIGKTTAKTIIHN